MVVTQKAERNAGICARLRAGGVTMADIARELGLTRERVRQIALREGITAATFRALLPPSKTAAHALDVEIKRRARHEKKAFLVQQILELRDKRFTQREIGVIVKIQQKRVSKILIAAGRRTKNQPIRVFRAPRKRKGTNQRMGAPRIVKSPRLSNNPHNASVVEQAKELWIRGLSAQRIALKLTTPGYEFSKNAIIGIAHRNNFPPRPSPIVGRILMGAAQ